MSASNSTGREFVKRSQGSRRSVSGGKLENVRLLKIDARVAFERLFLPQTIDHIHCLFPCPWPKKGHVKHRLFSNVFLKLINSRLKQKGQVKIVTDFCLTGEWVRGEIEGSGV